MFESTEKPTYHMASEDALVLWDATFDGLEFSSECYKDLKQKALRSLYQGLSGSWSRFSLSRSFYHQHLMSMLDDRNVDPEKAYDEHLAAVLHRADYTPIPSRKRKAFSR